MRRAIQPRRVTFGPRVSRLQGRTRQRAGELAASKEVLERVAWLLPRRCTVVFLAERGCAATELMAPLHQCGWP